ncbi:MAG: GNAT family N-acetyltransferase [Candidatus Lokiarchaeota archaeon]|nr:GNAT family N-acetyltransferase [Candidatus Lokiarchaeota archaeon]
MPISKQEHQTKLDLKKRRIRAFFLSIEKKKKKKEVIDESVEELYEDGMTYIQMRLPVDKITEAFENKLKDKVEHNIIKAIIRKAERGDLDSLKNIYNRAWLTSNTPFRPITKTDLLKILEAPDTVFLIAKVYGIDAAFVLLDFEGENKEFAVIAALAVLPRFQRRGLGKILGVYIWNFLKQNYNNVKEIRAEVYKDNKVSFAFIEGIGFEEYERRVYRKEDFEIETND